MMLIINVIQIYIDFPGWKVFFVISGIKNDISEVSYSKIFGTW